MYDRCNEGIREKKWNVRAAIIHNGGRWFLRNLYKICAARVCRTRIYVSVGHAKRELQIGERGEIYGSRLCKQ